MLGEDARGGIFASKQVRILLSHRIAAAFSDFEVKIPKLFAFTSCGELHMRGWTLSA